MGDQWRGGYRGSRRGGTSNSSRDFFGSSSGGPPRRDRDRDRDAPTRRPEPGSRMSGVQLMTRTRDKEDEKPVDNESVGIPAHHEKAPQRTIRVATNSTRSATGPFSPNRERERRGPASNLKAEVVATLKSSPTDRPERVGEKLMTDAVRLIGNDNVEESIAEFLGENTNYTVIGAIGPQGVGKSVILSMLGGNEAFDMYRHYAFRPASREAFESSRHQSTRINVYVSKSRKILLDCQAANSSSMLDEMLRCSRLHINERQDFTNHVENIHLIAFLMHVCHTILLVTDTVIDLEMFKMLHTAELMRGNMESVSGSQLPALNPHRMVNFAVVQTRAKSADFSTTVIRERVQLIRRIFAHSQRLRLSDDDNLVLFTLHDMKPLKESPSIHNKPVPDKLDQEEIVEFDKGMYRARILLTSLPKDPFTAQGQTMTEKMWLLFARSMWKDPTFQSVINQYTSFIH